MKSSGIVRKIDDLGRIVIPSEMRERLGLEPGVGLEIFFENNCITLKKYEATCVLCGNNSELVDHKGKKVCRNCISELSEN